MADKPSGSPSIAGASSKKLLIVAVVLAALVVVLYNYQVSRYRSAQTGRMVRLLQVNADKKAGDRLTRDDLDVAEMPAEFERGLKNCIAADQIDYAVSSTLNQPVRKGQWLLYEYTTIAEEASPSNRIQSRWVAHTVTIDPQRSPGEVLNVGDRVNILAMLAVNGKPLQAYRVIENVKVVAVGGRSYESPDSSDRRRAGSGAAREYRGITVELPPDASLQLANVLSHAQGNCWLEVRNPRDSAEGEGAAQVNRDLRNLTAAAKSPGKPGAVVVEQ